MPKSISSLWKEEGKRKRNKSKYAHSAGRDLHVVPQQLRRRLTYTIGLKLTRADGIVYSYRNERL